MEWHSHSKYWPLGLKMVNMAIPLNVRTLWEEWWRENNSMSEAYTRLESRDTESLIPFSHLLTCTTYCKNWGTDIYTYKWCVQSTISTIGSVRMLMSTPSHYILAGLGRLRIPGSLLSLLNWNAHIHSFKFQLHISRLLLSLLSQNVHVHSFQLYISKLLSLLRTYSVAPVSKSLNFETGITKLLVVQNEATLLLFG